MSAEDHELLAAVKSGKKKVVDNTNDNDGDEMTDEPRIRLLDWRFAVVKPELTASLHSN